MGKEINYLGIVKMPFEKMIKLTKKKSTRVDATFDNERTSYHTRTEAKANWPSVKK